MAFVKSNILFCCLLLAFYGKAQDSAFSSHFVALESNGSVLLSWIINQGNTCNGIDVYRAIDTPYFDYIGNIPGICGSGSAPQTFEFRDINPIRNKPLFYQVRFGESGYWNTTSILLLDLNKEGVQVRPNPVVDKARIYYANENGRLFTLELTTSTGTKLFSQQSSTTFFDLDLSGLAVGMYYYLISEVGETNQAIQGKITVAR
ncbi:MAG: hypothetical protein EAY81_08610 [Bacteroidetes bacterium]|nr:MAG: hypothetical protein EAY81_08610 [Bacteroidota bacterium]